MTNPIPFSITLPEGFTPMTRSVETVSSDAGDPIDVVVYMSHGMEGVCAVCFTRYNADVRLLDPLAVLDTNVEGLLENPTCKIQQQRDFRLDNHPAREIWYSETDEGFRYFTRMVCVYVEPCLFQVQFTTNEAPNLSAPWIDDYFNSFTLVPSGTP